MQPNQFQQGSAPPNPDLLQYMQSQYSQGWAMDQIIASARTTGWTEEQINACVALMSNAYAATQMGVNQTYASSADYGPPKPKIVGKVVRLIAGFIFVSILLGGLFVLVTGGKETKEEVFSRMLQNNYSTATFQRSVSVVSPDDQATISSTAKSDFSDPTNPKSEIDLTMKIDLDGTKNIDKGSIELVYEIIAINDGLWLRSTKSDIQLDADLTIAYQSLAVNGQTPEDVVRQLLGVDGQQNWKSYDANTFENELDDNNGIVASLIRTSFAANSVLNELMIADFGERATNISDVVSASNLYGVDYEQAGEEEVDKKKYTVFPVIIRQQEYLSVISSVSETLGLSDRYIDLLDQDIFQNESINLSLWVDAKSYRPYRLSTADLSVDTIYSDFGANYDIVAPQ